MKNTELKEYSATASVKQSLLRKRPKGFMSSTPRGSHPYFPTGQVICMVTGNIANYFSLTFDAIATFQIYQLTGPSMKH